PPLPRWSSRTAASSPHEVARSGRCRAALGRIVAAAGGVAYAALMTCATDADLEAFVEGELDPEALARVERALDECAHCRRRLGQLARSAEGRAESPDQAGRALDADVFEPGPDPHLGAVLGGRYRVLRRLGSGGMGAVYEAEHELICRRVAL